MKAQQAAPAAAAPRAMPSFRIGAVDDAAERQADAVADRVLGGVLRRKCTACEEEEPTLHRRATAATAIAGDAPQAVAAALAGGGRPLPAGEASFFAPRLGMALDGVRIHDGAAAERAARSVGAEAFALGQDIVFARNRFRPGTEGGRRLLAHELAHVMQAGPDTLRRSVPPGATLTEEAAGGCGICMPPSEAGNIAHRLIQQEFMLEFEIDPANRAPRFVEVSTPCRKGKGTRRPDLAEVRRKGTRRVAFLGSIKPAAQRWYDASEADFNANKACVLQVDPDMAVQPLQVPMPGVAVSFASALTKVLEGVRGEGCRPQNLKVNLPDEFGLYTYICKPTRRQVLSDPNCRCGKGKQEPFVERAPAREKKQEPKRSPRRSPVREPAPPVTGPLADIPQAIVRDAVPLFTLTVEGMKHDRVTGEVVMRALAEAADRLRNLIDMMEGEHDVYAKEKATVSAIGFAGFVTEWANDVVFPSIAIWSESRSALSSLRRAVRSGDAAAAIAAYNAARIAAATAQDTLQAYKSARDMGGERMQRRQIPAAAALVALAVVAAPLAIQGSATTLPFLGTGGSAAAGTGTALSRLVPAL